MAFAENVRRLRKKKGISQCKLAKSVGVSQSAIAQYEIGIKVPTIVIGAKLAKELDTTCEDLLSGNKKEGNDG